MNNVTKLSSFLQGSLQIVAERVTYQVFIRHTVSYHASRCYNSKLELADFLGFLANKATSRSETRCPTQFDSRLTSESDRYLDFHLLFGVCLCVRLP